MSRYFQYKVIKEPWCEEVPSHWDLLRLKRILQVRKERNNPIKTDCILSLSAKQGVVPYSEKEGTGGNKPKDDMTKYNIAHSGDLLVNCMNVVSGAAGVSNWFGAVSPVYYPLFPRNNEVNIWYYHYLFRLITFQRGLLGLGKGILMHESDEGVLTSVRMRISMDYLNNVNLPIPPRTEQDGIVRYLNWQVSKLNRLIMEKRKEISLFREQRKAIIDEGVLYGFSKAQTKNSGIFWLGDIPAHWQIKPLKRVCKVNASIAEQIKYMEDDANVVFLPMESVSVTGEVDYSQKKALHEVRSGFSSFAKGDVVVAKITPCFENGKGACLDNLDTCIGFGTTEFINLRPSEDIVSRYLYLLTMTRPFRKLGEDVMTGTAGQKRISPDYIKNFAVGIPDVEEQYKILREIDHRLYIIDEQIQCEEKSIEILHELRTRLISDVVTGQIDVRGIEVPDFDMVEEIDSDEENLDDEDVAEETEEQEVE